jgi:hypothetical protein
MCCCTSEENKDMERNLFAGYIAVSIDEYKQQVTQYIHFSAVDNYFSAILLL